VSAFPLEVFDDPVHSVSLSADDLCFLNVTSQTLVAGPRALFVYYRMPVVHSLALYEGVVSMQADLRARFPALQTRLMVRSDNGPDSAGRADEQAATWMEVYEHPDGITPACESALLMAAHELTAQGMGPRHVESFGSLTARVAG
jgi:hypothetical protein